MNWLAFCCVGLQFVSKRVPTKILKLVALLLSIPCFKASHFCFKFVYALNQRRLRRLCSEDFFLKFYNRRVAIGGVVHILQSLRNIESGLKAAEASHEFCGNHITLQS